MTFARRALVLAALLFWHGGATFYAAVAIPVGLSVLDSPAHQTFVTQAVTNWLNLAGAVAVVVFAWDLLAGGDACTARRRCRWAAWLGTAATLALMAWLHPQLDALMDRQCLVILDRAALRPLHHAYLGVSGVQWLCATAYAFLTLHAWTDDTPAEGCRP